MWIRSQNNYILANVNSIRICKCNLDDCVYYSIHGHYDRYEQSLGYYSTKEKALKVLDEIQTSIMAERQFRIDELNCTRNYFGKEYKGIYRMPQDEDVEE